MSGSPGPVRRLAQRASYGEWIRARSDHSGSRVRNGNGLMGCRTTPDQPVALALIRTPVERFAKAFNPSGASRRETGSGCGVGNLAFFRVVNETDGTRMSQDKSLPWQTSY